MITKINVPNIGENELEVTEILVKIGDNIKTKQSLIIIEGDKLSIEIPTLHSGTITNIHVHVGDKVHTGSLILSLNVTDQNDILSYHNENNILQNTTSQSNTLQDNQIKKYSERYNNNYINKNNIETTTNFIYATPLIRYMARKLEIDLSKIKGSGRKGRILKEDIYNYINAPIQNNDVYHQSTKKSEKNFFISSSTMEIDFKKFGDIKIIPLNKIQKISSINLQKNWNQVPHVTQFDEVDITDIEIFRKQQNFEIKKKKMNYKITPLIFVMKAVSKVLEELPNFNSSLSKNGEILILKKYINIGIAVDTPQGLLVPVIKNVNKKGITLLSQELSEIVKKTRSKNQLTPKDMQGGSFTISSLGNIGGGSFTPIINTPEVAILGISKSFIKPIWTEKKFIPRVILPISLSYDHRVINGADGARFLTFINKIISDIRLLSM